MAQAENEKLKVFEGSFEKIQSGDYTHLIARGADGKLVSFVCMDLPPAAVKGVNCVEFQFNTSKFVGKKIKITYYEKKSFIKEANKSLVWSFVERIDFAN